MFATCIMHELSMNHISLHEDRLDVVQSQPLRRTHFGQCTEVTGRWGLLSHAQNAFKWLALSIPQVDARYSLIHSTFTMAWKTGYVPE